MDENYINGVYDSCKNIILPATGGLVLDASCGEFDSKSCSPKRWYKFMGDPDGNPVVPFRINYKYDKPDTAFEAETKRCNESYPVATFPFFPLIFVSTLLTKCQFHVLNSEFCFMLLC